MKSTKTMQCKLCMMERREILHRFWSDKSKIMNHNSEIFGTCKCNPRFHQFYRKLTVETLKTRMMQKKVTSTRHSKQKRSRKSQQFTFSLSPQKSRKRPCCPHEATPVTPKPASPLAALVIFYDTNVPGLPYRVPPPIPWTLSSLKSNTIFNFNPREFQLIVELEKGTAAFSSWSLNFRIEISATTPTSSSTDHLVSKF
jgi:hypothetical protein